ncbi:DUF1266 domain-containing protein [Streptomyces sp. P38-E01]|uniref:DUF1266 domain-containing protein n=1 Tax=Streptomyces tardus TaxID=2780544 RepID=A0A949JFK2_9ACTN|nr:DUF1266 domain-containing protein [Streptomyces tardus]MBU7599096.1 DUF1266 domain-containing protein [Streptomyces tardus]
MGYVDTSGTRVRNGPDRAAQTVIERRLHEAKVRGDVEGYLRILAGTHLYHLASKDHFRTHPGRVGYATPRDPGHHRGRRTLYVRTQGDLPGRPRDPDEVQHRLRFGQLVERDSHQEDLVIEVNPGSVSGMRFPFRDRSRFERMPWDRALWEQMADEVPPPSHGDDLLLTDRSGPLRGELAHGLACGAHLAVHRRVIWNRFGDIDTGYLTDRETLERDWGVTSTSGGREQLRALLAHRNSPAAPEIALKCRNALSEREGGGDVDPERWREFAQEVADRNELPPGLRKLIEDAVERVPVYEQRFRQDGMLPPGGFVRTLAGYDYGRAVNFARWVVSARYFEPEDLVGTASTVGGLVQQAYDSWEDFSAGYTLGRVLRFDDGRFGHWYESALIPHRLLVQDPESPWRTIPFR